MSSQTGSPLSGIYPWHARRSHANQQNQGRGGRAFGKDYREEALSLDERRWILRYIDREFEFIFWWARCTAMPASAWAGHLETRFTQTWSDLTLLLRISFFFFYFYITFLQTLAACNIPKPLPELFYSQRFAIYVFCLLFPFHFFTLLIFFLFFFTYIRQLRMNITEPVQGIGSFKNQLRFVYRIVYITTLRFPSPSLEHFCTVFRNPLLHYLQIPPHLHAISTSLKSSLYSSVPIFSPLIFRILSIRRFRKNFLACKTFWSLPPSLFFFLRIFFFFLDSLQNISSLYYMRKCDLFRWALMDDANCEDFFWARRPMCSL